MIKFKQGQIKSKDGEWVDIIVKSRTPNNLKDIVIGGVLVLAGVSYLTYTAFKKGSINFELAEFNTLMKLGYIDDNMNSTVEEFHKMI